MRNYIQVFDASTVAPLGSVSHSVFEFSVYKVETSGRYIVEIKSRKLRFQCALVVSDHEDGILWDDWAKADKICSDKKVLKRSAMNKTVLNSNEKTVKITKKSKHRLKLIWKKLTNIVTKCEGSINETPFYITVPASKADELLKRLKRAFPKISFVRSK